MATSGENVVCEYDPNFAVITNFLIRFGPSIGFVFNISDFKSMLEDIEKTSDELIDLHIKLLRKKGKYINKDKWEKALVKFIAEYSNIDAWELERYGYKNVKLSIKLESLKRLLEAQFDCNTKFKSEVNALETNSLRISPIGRDMKGHLYWYQIDDDVNLRIYKEKPDDDYLWSLICQNKDQLAELILNLEACAESSVLKDDSPPFSDNEENKSQDAIKKEILEESYEELYFSEKMLVKVEEKEMIDNENINCLESTPNLSKVQNESSDAFYNIKSEEEKATVSLQPTLDGECNESQIQMPTEEKKIAISVDVDVPDTAVENDILQMLNEVLDKVLLIELADYEEKSSPNEDDETIRDVCKCIIDEVCRLEDDEIECRGRGRGRPRGRGRRRGRGGILGKSRSLSNCVKKETIFEEIEDPETNEPPPLKRSRRIQMMQEKKSAQAAEQMRVEQQRLEELAKKRAQMAKEREERRQQRQLLREGGKVEPDKKRKHDQDFSSASSDEYSCQSAVKRKKRRKKASNCPWESDSSTTSSSDSSVDEEVEDEDEVLKFDDNEDEFACEEPELDSEPVITKRARTAKKVRSVSVSEEESSSVEEENDDTPCKRCGKYDHPEWILLCDKCDTGYHTACINPPLMIIPDGNWFCPPCDHKTLLEKLHQEFNELDKLLEKRSREELRKQRLQFAAISVDNILRQPIRRKSTEVEDKTPKNEESLCEEESRVRNRQKDAQSADEDDEEEDDEEEDESDSEDEGYRIRRRRVINYQFKEYDDLINSAIQESATPWPNEEVEQTEVENVDPNCQISLSRDVTESNVNEDFQPACDKSDPAVADPTVPESRSEDEAHFDNPKTKDDNNSSPYQTDINTKVKKKHRGLNDLESPSDENDSDESFRGSSDTEIDDNLSDEEFVDDNGSETDVSDLSDWQSTRRTRNTRSSASKKKKSANKKASKKKNYRRDDFVVDSDDSDDFVSKPKSKTRAAARKRISYKEVSSDDEEEEYYGYKTQPKSKKRVESNSSGDDWAECSKKSDKKQKVRELSDYDDDEEDGEDDEDNNDDEDGDDNEDDEEEVESNEKNKTNKIEMRGKPRLSKLVDLDKNSRTFESPKKEVEVEKETPSVSEDHNDHADVKDETISTADNIALKDKNDISDTRNKLSASVENKSTTVMQKSPLSNEEVVNISLPKSNSETKPAVLPMNSASVSIPSTITCSSTSSPLSQLTAFAARGPNNSPSAQQSYFPSPTMSTHHIMQVNSADGDDNESYSLTSLDGFPGRPKPLKPSLVGDNYPHASSPTRIMQLDSGSFPRPVSPPRLTSLDNYPPNSFDPKHGHDAFMASHRLPPPYGGPRNFDPKSGHQPQHFTQSPRNFYPPGGTFMRGPVPNAGHIQPHRYGTVAPSNPSLYRGPQSRGPPFQPPPQPIAYGGPGHHAVNYCHSQPPNSLQPLPPNYPPRPYPGQNVPPHYLTYYSHAGGPSPNGGFMIQNLLQQRVGGSDGPVHSNTSSSNGANTNPAGEDDELRNVADIVSFITQE